jgi:integrase
VFSEQLLSALETGPSHPFSDWPNPSVRDPNNFAKQWRAARDELGMPEVTTHSFRKTVATLIDDEGMSACRRGPTGSFQRVDDPGQVHDPGPDSRRGCGVARPHSR